jgi:hypothetical protein
LGARQKATRFGLAALSSNKAEVTVVPMAVHGAALFHARGVGQNQSGIILMAELEHGGEGRG